MKVEKDMTKKELLIETLNHREQDIMPYQLNLTGDVQARLLKELGEDFFVNNVHNAIADVGVGQTITVDEKRQQDPFGVIWLNDQKGDFGVVEHVQIPEAEFGDYIFPEAREDYIRQRCEAFLNNPANKGKMTMFNIGFSMFERAWTLRGMENLLMDFIAEPDFAHELMERITQYNLAVMEIALTYDFDIMYFGDDWGQQKGLIMGPDYWRKFIKPYVKRMYAYAKQKGKYICQHSCGDIYEIFPDLIEIGLDIYNTFQPQTEIISKSF